MTGTIRPLRVAFDARDLTAAAPRGMVRYLLGLAQHLPAHGVSVTFFHRAREPLNPVHLRGLDCRVIGLRDLGGLTWEQVAVPAALAGGGFDLYHAPAERGVPLVAPCPVVFTYHSATGDSYRDLVHRGQLPGPASRYLGYDPDLGRWGWRRAYSRAQLRRADHLLAPSAFAGGELVQFLRVPLARVTVTPLGISEEFSRSRDSVATAAVLARHGIRLPYLLFVGGYEPHKNVTGLLETFAAVRQTRPDLALVAVGTKGVPAEVVEAATARGLAPGREIHFLADLGDELVHLYDGAAVFVSMSWRETFGMPALEAMARGVPVVASRWGAGPEVVGDAGELVDPRDPAAAAAAVLRILDPAIGGQLAARAASRTRLFTYERTAAQTRVVYDRMLDQRAAHSGRTHADE